MHGVERKPVRRRRDGDATRGAIIEAAIAIFSRHGYEGASIDQIADASGSSRSLILHHFTSKPELWKAAQAELARRFDEAHGSLDATQPVTPELLRRFLKTYLGYFRDDAKLLRLGLWAQAQGEVAAWPGEERILPGIVAMVERGQAAGFVRTDVPAINIVIALCGMLYFWLLNRNRFHSGAGVPLAEAGSDDGFIEDALRFVLVEAAATRPEASGAS